jgi:N6-adenosine-specific RNA methylase IME4
VTFLAVIDPPWNRERGGGGRGAENHYPLSGPDEIARAVVESGAWQANGNALVWVWATSATMMRGDFFEFARALDVRPCAQFVWAKVDVVEAYRDKTPWCPSSPMYVAPAKPGLGQWTRCEHEHLVVCRRGDVSVPPPGRRSRSMIYAARSKHSEKPGEAWTVIESTSSHLATVGVEFFARRRRRGGGVVRWGAWGRVDGEDQPIRYEPPEAP